MNTHHEGIDCEWIHWQPDGRAKVANWRRPDSSPLLKRTITRWGRRPSTGQKFTGISTRRVIWLPGHAVRIRAAAGWVSRNINIIWSEQEMIKTDGSSWPYTLCLVLFVGLCLNIVTSNSPCKLSDTFKRRVKRTNIVIRCQYIHKYLKYVTPDVRCVKMHHEWPLVILCHFPAPYE